LVGGLNEETHDGAVLHHDRYPADPPPYLSEILLKVTAEIEQVTSLFPCQLDDCRAERLRDDKRCPKITKEATSNTGFSSFSSPQWKSV